MRAVLVAIVCLCVLPAVSALAPLLGGPETEVIEGEYIVVLRPQLNGTEAQLYIKDVTHRIVPTNANYVMNTYSIRSFHGFSARLTPAMLAAIREDPQVEHVEPNMIAKASQSCSQQVRTPSWGLDRVDDHNVDLDGNFRYTSTAGLGVDAYIIDTGILVEHQDFGGRATWGFDAFGEKTPTDCNGHGTHVAGTVAGTAYGLAKKASLVAVKVLNCQGSGSYAGVIEGVEYVAKAATSSRRPSVANMSLGGPVSAALNAAIEEAVKLGITFVVAAGNDNNDACRYSPAMVPSAITVGATTTEDEVSKQVDGRSYFSNVGPCVDILAPGSSITSTWIGSNTAVHTISGTSMASPHVAGVAALYLSQHPTSTPEEVAKYLIGSATVGKVDLECAKSDQACTQTPNRLLYYPCDATVYA